MIAVEKLHLITNLSQVRQSHANNCDNNLTMQLPDEILKQIRILTDKPNSPKVNKQLLPLLLHENLPLQKTIPLLCLKYRADLIIYLLQNGRYPLKPGIHKMLNSILTNILEYKTAELIQIWLLVLNNEQQDKQMLEVGYLQLAKIVIKQPNLQTKQATLKIICSNFQHFYKSKMKKIVKAIASNFIDLFLKFLIYVPSFAVMIELILQVDKDSKRIINSPHPQRQPNLEDIFIDLSSRQLSAIKNQSTLILQNTKQKANYYSLHRSCLIVLKKIAQILNIFKVKESQLQFKQIDIGKILKTIELFTGRKGTIDEARFAKTEWLKRAAQTKKLRDERGQKRVNAPIQDPTSLLFGEKQKHVLIQDVISLTNNYRLKYQVQPERDNDSRVTQTNVISVANNFLKKGGGAGGGRTYLLDKSSVSHKKNVQNHNKRKYDDLVDQCFEDYQKDLVYKSFTESVPILPIAPFPKLKDQQPKHEGKKLSYVEIPEQQYASQMKIQQQNQAELSIDIDNLPAFSNNYHINENKKKMNQSTYSLVEDDEEVEEICNLIDLAYSYKFS